LQVTGGALASITIGPASAAITAGGSQAYSATGLDQYNNSLGDVASWTSFSISLDGLRTGVSCTPSKAGAHAVTGNDSGKAAMATWP